MRLINNFQTKDGSIYSRKQLASLLEVTRFLQSKQPSYSINDYEFIRSLQGRFDHFAETSAVVFNDNSILFCGLIPEHHYSEQTIEGAEIVYYAYELVKAAPTIRADS